MAPHIISTYGLVLNMDPHLVPTYDFHKQFSYVIHGFHIEFECAIFMDYFSKGM
jgi:hypothetical protein